MSHRAEARRARRRWCAVLLLVAALSGPTATAAAQQPQQPPSQEFDALLASGARSLDGGDLAAAEKALRRALRLRPGQPAATALLGNVVRRAGRLEEAEQLLRAAVHAAPAYYPARLWLGQTLLALARPEEAVEQLRTAAELAPREPAPRAFLAQALLRARRLDAAAHAASELVQLAPEEAAAHSLLATIELERGRAESALASFRRATALRDEPAARYGEAAALAALGRDKEALEVLTGVLERAPDNADAWSLFARVLARSGPAPEALVGAAEFYQEALRHRPGHAGDTLALAQLYLRLGLFREGLALLESIATEARDRADVWLLRGQLAAKAGAYEEARGALERAIELAAGSPAWYELGVVLVNLSDLPAAGDAFARATALDPTHAAAWRELGRVCLDRNRIDDALAALARAVELVPDDATSHLLLGRALQRAGRAAEAVAQLEQAVRLAPRNEQALYALATALASAGEQQRSRELLERLRELRRAGGDAATVRSNKAALLLRDAGVRARLGYDEAAVALLRQALEVAPDSAAAHLQLGLALARLGRREEAIAALQAATRLQESAQAWAALAQLYAQAGRAADAERARARAAELAPRRHSPAPPR